MNAIVPSSRRTSLNFILISSWHFFCRLVADSYFEKNYASFGTLKKYPCTLAVDIQGPGGGGCRGESSSSWFVRV